VNFNIIICRSQGQTLSTLNFSDIKSNSLHQGQIYNYCLVKFIHNMLEYKWCASASNFACTVPVVIYNKQSLKLSHERPSNYYKFYKNYLHQSAVTGDHHHHHRSRVRPW